MDRFIQSNLRVGILPELTDAAIDDLRYFESKAMSGQAIKFDALYAWMEKNHGLTLKKGGLYTACTKAGIMPWWSRR
jgi:hypothetical protein